MALNGTIPGMPPEDLFQLIDRGQKSGVLSIKSESEVRNLFFVSGNISGANSSRAKDRLGAFLLRHRKITPQQFVEIRKSQDHLDTQMGTLLVSEKIITPHELNAILEMQVLSIVLDVLCLNKAEFIFEERPIGENECIIKNVKTSTILLEAARQKDEFIRIREEFESDDMVFVKSNDPPQLSSETEKNIWEAFTNPCTLGELLERINDSESKILQTVKTFLHLGVIERDLTEEALRKQNSAKIKNHLDRAQTLRNDKAYHDSLIHLKEVLNIEPEHKEAIDLIKAVSEEIVTTARKMIPSEKDIPKIRQTFASLREDKFVFTPKESFVFSRIDGCTNVKNLRHISQLDLDNLYIILHKFVRMGLIYIDSERKNVGQSSFDSRSAGKKR